MKLYKSLAILFVAITMGLISLHPFHTHQQGQHVHRCGVDVAFGVFTAEEIARMESLEPDSALSSKTHPNLFLGPGQDDVLTFVIDIKEAGQPVTSDIFGNQIGTFDFVEFGFSQADFDLLADTILAEVFDDYFDELAGTVANQNGEQLDINFILGDIGTAPAGISEFYFIQVGSTVNGAASLGVAGGGVVRSAEGLGPNFGIEVGDVVGSVFSDNIQNLGGLTPGDALASGDLQFTTNAIVGTLSHEIGHTLSLSHINFANSMQPTAGRAPIMGTGAIDLPNQARLEDREFSLAGFDEQSGNATQFHVDQLACAIGPLSDIKNKLTYYYTGPNGGDFFDEVNWNDDPQGSGSAPPAGSVSPSGDQDIGINLIIDGSSVIAAGDIDIGNRGSGSLTLLNGASLEVTGTTNDLDFDFDGSFTLINSTVTVADNIFFGGTIELIGGSVISGDDIDFSALATVTIDGTTLTAFDNIDFQDSFQSINGAAFSHTGGGDLRIDGPNSIVEFSDTEFVIGLPSNGFGNLESAGTSSDGGTLILRGDSNLTLNEVREGVDLLLFDKASVIVESSFSGVGDGGSTITLFSSTNILDFPSDSTANFDRRDFVINGMTGLTYSQDSSTWTNANWNGLDGVTLQIVADVLIGDVNLDGNIDLLDVAPFADRILEGVFQIEADINLDGIVDLLDVAPFVDLLAG